MKSELKNFLIEDYENSIYAITGTNHGSIVEAKSEGEARELFHKIYKGESIIFIKKRNDSNFKNY